jgi:hypothetical protein
MSTEKNFQNNPTARQSKYALIGSFIIILCVVGIGIVSFFIGKKEGEKQTAPSAVINYNGGGQPAILGDQVNNWNGTIVSIDGNKLVLAVPGATADAPAQQISAIITPATQLMKWDLTKTPTAGGSSETGKEFITIDQLSAGQRALVQAKNDINDQQEVAATNISLIITPVSL